MALALLPNSLGCLKQGGPGPQPYHGFVKYGDPDALGNVEEPTTLSAVHEFKRSL